MTCTTGPAPPRPHSSYRHEAYLYRGAEEFLAGTVPFVREGIASGQPVMVAVVEPRAGLLREALGADAAEVEFVDMAVLGRNPARIIPGWRRFLDEHCRDEQPVRGIGEPIWSGRRAAEVAECQLHEALLNLAVDPDTPMWLRCPYDVEALDPAVVEEAHRSHPILVELDSYAGSRWYGGAHHVSDSFGAGLPEPPEHVEGVEFGWADLAPVRDAIAAHAAVAGLDAERTWELALAAHEVAVNSVRHGGGRGTLRVWREPEALCCEIRDSGRIDDPLAGRRPPVGDQEDGRGLWLANQLCDLVQVRSGPEGTAVRIVSWL
jgi:anti-sigma regulatory factor (Ser/Thr protein kinase)